MYDDPKSNNPLVSKLCDLFDNRDFADRLVSKISSSDLNRDQIYIRVDATLCASSDDGIRDQQMDDTLPLGWIDLVNPRIIAASPKRTAPGARDNNGPLLTPQSISADESTHAQQQKRRKCVGGLRLSKPSPRNMTGNDSGSESDIQTPANTPKPDNRHGHARQCHISTRFPQRKNLAKSSAMPVARPTSADKLISGIWRQLYSPIQLALPSGYQEPGIDIRTGVSDKVFQAVNRLCMKYYNQNQSSRALEMIVQAYWLECYEARIASVCVENPNYSATEARMTALKEACHALGWQEKDLRNRMAIWRGYKEIKDAGGWASLIFAGTGVYRFCKYRMGFDECLIARLRQLASSCELAADTLHPGWRDLLRVISQDGPQRYHGHPHDWVTVATGQAVPLASTYHHLQLPSGFEYQFVDECVIDLRAFGGHDPRVRPGINPDTCQFCEERQSDDIRLNRCSCFPTLFGGPRCPVAVQLFRTANGKNNGVVARYNFDRGAAIAEFVGLITSGIDGIDVMVGGTPVRPYQIYQGHVGNFTRFINHSCRPNSQFQRFFWRGKERIVVVSRGISADSEITVDYSDQYWRQLNKNCLCGEPCCRFASQV